MRKLFLISCFALFISADTLVAQKTINNEAFAHTYSIVARDAKTGEMAVGVQSHWFSVGTVVPWAKAGVGAIATQSFVNTEYGQSGIPLLAKGVSPEEVFETIAQKDEGKAFRQVGIIDADGNTFAHTGERNIKFADHITGENYSVQANMMKNEKVVPAMAKAFEEYADLPLAERVINVLKAAQNAGGDIRGKQSAALIVVSGERNEKEDQPHQIDLRVDDHQDPVQELSRLLQVKHGYELMNQADVALETNQVEKALSLYNKAEELMPENQEVKFWKAVGLLNTGETRRGLEQLKIVFKQNSDWQKLIQRLPASGLLEVDKRTMNIIEKM
jgi:uncharacterized Ntn-hydrolase superfamily protein